jgi:hypothetical protein
MVTRWQVSNNCHDTFQHFGNARRHVRMIEKTYAKILAEKRRDFIERGAPSLAIT